MPITASPNALWWDPLVPATVLFGASGFGFALMIGYYRKWNSGVSA
jgi:hypothetical protein